MRRLSLALVAALHFLVFSISAQEITPSRRISPTAGTTTFPVWLTTKVDAGKLRVGDEVRFKSDSAFLLGTTVVPPAVFCGRVVYVQKIEGKEQRESRLGIAVEQVKWKMSSLSLNAYIVGFGSYRVIDDYYGPAQSACFQSRPPNVPEFTESSGTVPMNVERKTMHFENFGPIYKARNVVMFDYARSVKEIRIVRTTVERKPGTILLRRDHNIVLPKSLPVMLELVEPERKQE